MSNMGEDESMNEVSKANSNGKSIREKTLYEMTENKDLETMGGNVLENKGVKELKEDDLTEIEDKKADNVEEVEEDKKVGYVDEAKEDKKYDGMVEEEEDKEAEGVEEVKEDNEVDGVNEVLKDKRVEGTIDIEEDKKYDNGNEKMDEDTEVKETIETTEEKEKGKAAKPKIDAMEVEGTTTEESIKKEKIKVEEEVIDNDKSKEEEKVEDSKVEKGSKKHGRGKMNEEKVEEKRKEPSKTDPRTPTIDRPIREKKPVMRLITSIENDATKEFHIRKGRGTSLKDIPNVAFKLSRKKTDDTFKLLHRILFGRRGKAVQIKSNILRFSGFAWPNNEEKQMIKVKERFDKCNKERLLEFCDVLDITLVKEPTRKEDIIAKLIDFLVAPHATTTVLAEKESSKGKKCNRIVKSRSGTTTSKRPTKSQKKNIDSSAGEKKSTTDTEAESEEEEDEESEEEMLEKSESEDKSDFESEYEDVKKTKKTYKTAPSKKESAAKSNSDVSPKVYSRRKKNEKQGKQKTTIPANKTEKVTEGRANKKQKLNPSDDQLRDAICEILKDVDLNTTTVGDIMQQLAKQFDMDIMDLNPRKASIKIMIQEELAKSDEEDGDDDDEEDETQSSSEEEV